MGQRHYFQEFKVTVGESLCVGGVCVCVCARVRAQICVSLESREGIVRNKMRMYLNQEGSAMQ